jgi:hypothetical protein
MRMPARAILIFCIVCIVCFVPLPATAQSPISTIVLGPNQIGLVRTAQALTTRISFPEQVQEIICGDLYDPASGKGSFVIQRSGKDIFIKPVSSKGMSNLFVKTGENGERTYNFDIAIATPAQAHRVINVMNEPEKPAPQKPPATRAPAQPQADAGQPGGGEDSIKQATAQAEEILGKARRQASQTIADAEARAAETERQASEQAEREIERRLVRGMLLGTREVKIESPRTVGKKVTISLDPRVLVFDEKSYVRYTLQNSSATAFEFSSISLESGSARGAVPVSIQVMQTKPENKLDPGESLAGVLVFDSKSIPPGNRVVLYVRGENNVEIVRVYVQ